MLNGTKVAEANSVQNVAPIKSGSAILGRAVRPSTRYAVAAAHAAADAPYRGAVIFGVPIGGERQGWRMRRDLLSPCYTTRWTDPTRVEAFAMPSVTYHVVLLFNRDPDTGELVAEEGQEAPSAQSAMTCAGRMVGRKAGAVAFSRKGDSTIGEFDDAVALGRYGEVPTDPTSFTSAS